MIEWVTVWVLTVSTYDYQGYHAAGSNSYQLTYATHAICEKEKVKHTKVVARERSVDVRCDFQQVPVFDPNKKVK